MKTLYLLRHAKSDWANPNLADLDRPLNERGIKASQRLGELFEAQSINPNLILCSPARRTRQTLSLIAEVTGKDYNCRFEADLYETGASHILKLIRHLPDSANSAMIIGHNPGLEMLAHELIRPSNPEALTRLHEKFPAGGLATLAFHTQHWKDIGPEGGDLVDFVTPRELK
jgi:phosphohistidine phosphatase